MRKWFIFTPAPFFSASKGFNKVVAMGTVVTPDIKANMDRDMELRVDMEAKMDMEE